MKNKIEYINKLLKTHTAFSFAEEKLSDIKKGCIERKEDYRDYMYDVFSGSVNPIIKECEQNAIHQFVLEYAKLCQVLIGFLVNGSVFILDRKNKFVSFLYEHRKGMYSAMTYYNPTNYDCLEWCNEEEVFIGKIQSEEFILSKNENDIIKECDLLIGLSNSLK